MILVIANSAPGPRTCAKPDEIKNKNRAHRRLAFINRCRSCNERAGLIKPRCRVHDFEECAQLRSKALFLSNLTALSSRLSSVQNSGNLMITRPRQISLRQTTLHFSCTGTAPHTGRPEHRSELARPSLISRTSRARNSPSLYRGQGDSRKLPAVS